jgi:hypothetical protein
VRSLVTRRAVESHLTNDFEGVKRRSRTAVTYAMNLNHCTLNYSLDMCCGWLGQGCHQVIPYLIFQLSRKATIRSELILSSNRILLALFNVIASPLKDSSVSKPIVAAHA